MLGQLLSGRCPVLELSIVIALQKPNAPALHKLDFLCESFGMRIIERFESFDSTLVHLGIAEHLSLACRGKIIIISAPQEVRSLFCLCPFQKLFPFLHMTKWGASVNIPEGNNAKYNEPIYVIPFGDVHRSAPLCHVEKWKEFLEWAKTKKRAYFLGCGDYDDLASTSEREMLGNPKMHESTVKTLESLYYSHTKRFAEEIKFMKGRCIGFLEGNHYGQFQNGTTTTQKLAEHLECKYLGVSSFIRLSFQPIERSGPLSIDIWAHHGQGASRLLGGSLNRVQQM